MKHYAERRPSRVPKTIVPVTYPPFVQALIESISDLIDGAENIVGRRESSQRGTNSVRFNSIANVSLEIFINARDARYILFILTEHVKVSGGEKASELIFNRLKAKGYSVEYSRTCR